MVEEADKKRTGSKSGKGRLIAILVVLVLLIAGLVGGIVWVVSNKNKKETPNLSPDLTYRDSDLINHGGVAKPSEEIRHVLEAIENADEEEGARLYEDVIAKSTTEVDKMRARIEYAGYLIDMKDLDRAFVELSLVDESLLDDGYKCSYYAKMRDYYDEIGEDELSDIYNEKLSELKTTNGYGIGG